MLWAVTLLHQNKFLFERRLLGEQCGHFGFTRHAGQPQELLGIAGIRSSNREIAVDLGELRLDQILAGREFRDLGLRLLEHGLHGGSPLAFTEILHAFLGCPHPLAQAVRLFHQERTCRTGGLGSLVVDIPEIFLRISIRQLDGQPRITRGNEDVDQACIEAIGSVGHPHEFSGRLLRGGITPKACCGDKLPVLGKFEVVHHPQGKRIAPDEVDQSIDHVDRLDLIVAHLLHLETQHLALDLLNEENRTRPIEILLGDSRENAPHKRKS